jgi:hypothetical protein
VLYRVRATISPEIHGEAFCLKIFPYKQLLQMECNK